MLLYYKIIPVIPRQSLHFTAHVRYQFFQEEIHPVVPISKWLQLIRYLKSSLEYRTLYRHHIYSLFALFLYPEELKVTTEIKYIEQFFIFTVQQSFAKSGSPSYHLPEFCLTHYLLEKYQIEYLWNIYSCIKHINWYGYLWQFVRIRKVIYCFLRKFCLIIYNFRVPNKMRIFLIEYFKYLLCVSMILCKYYCFSYLLPVIYLDSIIHKYT